MNFIYWIPIAFAIGIFSALILITHAFKKEFGRWPWEDK